MEEKCEWNTLLCMGNNYIIDVAKNTNDFLVRSVYLSLSGRNAYKHNRCIHWHGNAYYFFFGNIFNYEYDFCVM